MANTTLELNVVRDDTRAAIEALAAVESTRFACTPAYLAARQAMGDRPWVLTLTDGGQVVAGAVGFARTQWGIYRTLEIPTLPDVDAGSAFWRGLLAACREASVDRLELGTYASDRTVIPPIPGENARRPRTEYVLHLPGADLKRLLHEGHRRHVNRARKKGVTIRRATDRAACDAHVRLMNQSMSRRSERGEDVATESDAAGYAPYLDSAAGVLYQALLGEEVLSSVLLLLAPRAAYYQSAGTSSAGMECGASHLLVHEISLALQSAGMELLRLGGVAEENPGLHRFKSGFGAEALPLERVSAVVGSRLRHRLYRAASLLRHDPWGMVRMAAYQVERYAVYSVDPREVPAAEPPPDCRIEKLDDAVLAGLVARGAEWAWQWERRCRDGFNAAYGVYCGDHLAHVAWLIFAENDRDRHVRVARLRAGEAEITHCLTDARHRGRGLYPFAIRSLCRIAAERTVSRILMLTYCENAASKRGIEKAGLTLCGHITRWMPLPLILGGWAVTRRTNHGNRDRSGDGA